MNEIELIFILYVFVLAIFVGFELIAKVPPTLHTPLMSGANAISGITIIGALIVAGQSNSDVTISLFGLSVNIVAILGLFALIFATINVTGGFAVTDRMLQMFKKGK
jgi:NAD(P) transhydrogenase subunit alpha